MRIAVIGAGISGLVAAHRLRSDHEVVVFEADARPGGHAHTVRVDTDDDTFDVDTGFIVFNDRNYPVFEALLDELHVLSQPSDMGFSVSDEHGDFEYAGTGLNGLFAKRSHLLDAEFRGMVRDLLRFNRASAQLLDEPGADELSLRAFLRREGYGEAFVEKLIVPQVSAVWSADPGQLDTFPARFLAEFLRNHGMLGFRDRPRWRTVVGGSHQYVRAITAPLGERLRLATPIERVRRTDDEVLITARGHEAEAFDHVVIATHSDQALAMLTDPSERESELLGSFAYQPNEAALHTDTRMLPRRRRAWASWNYHLLDEPPALPVMTYHMNTLQALRADREFCVTLNRTAEIDPDKLIRVESYAHPVYTTEAVRNQGRVHEISGAHTRTSYCGAYWGWGFHEDGAASGVRAASDVDARVAVPA